MHSLLAQLVDTPLPFQLFVCCGLPLLAATILFWLLWQISRGSPNGRKSPEE